MATSESKLSEFVVENKNHILSRVNEHGAVLLRGWTADATEFSKVANALGEFIHDMSCSAGPRVEVVPGVHTANEAPPSEIIPFHHEMAQCVSPPKYVLFYCDTPPVNGGATPIIHSWRLTEKLKASYPYVAEKIRKCQIRYVREFPPNTDMTSPLGKSWKATLNVTTREEAEKELSKQGFEWEWLSQGRLRTIGPVVPMFIQRNGKDILFTAAETVFLNGTCPGRPEKSFIHGDGTPLDLDVKEAFVSLGKFAFENSVRVPWKRGDILIIDNATVMHARDSFTPPRRILVSLVGRL